MDNQFIYVSLYPQPCYARLPCLVPPSTFSFLGLWIPFTYSYFSFEIESEKYKITTEFKIILYIDFKIVSTEVRYIIERKQDNKKVEKTIKEEIESGTEKVMKHVTRRMEGIGEDCKSEILKDLNTK